MRKRLTFSTHGCGICLFVFHLPPTSIFDKPVGGSVDPSASPSLQPPHQRARRSAAPTESSQRDIDVSVVRMCWHVKRWFELYVCALQSGHIGVERVSGEIW